MNKSESQPARRTCKGFCSRVRSQGFCYYHELCFKNSTAYKAAIKPSPSATDPADLRSVPLAGQSVVEGEDRYHGIYLER